MARSRTRWPLLSSGWVSMGVCCCASGTEPVVRVMVEAAHPEIAEAECQTLADIVKEELTL